MDGKPSVTARNCAAVVAYPKYGGNIGKWDNVRCKFQHKAVCEADPLGTC